jgi:TPR repeat protein
MPRITISYRREDSLDITGRICDRLMGHFGHEAVFRDIDSIPPGADFRRHIDRVLDQSDIILAIVGQRWIGPDNAQLRLANPADPVRLEIETALRKDKPLIPVLVSRAVMPQPDVLPASLHDFVYRHAVQVDSGQDFDFHVRRLIRAIERIDEQRTADEAVQGAPPIEPAPKPERPAEAARQAEEEKRRTEAARQAEEEKRRTEAARQAEEETRQAATTRTAEPSVVSVPPIGRPVPGNGGHTVRWVIALGLVVMLGIISAGGWWVLVEQPRREAAAVVKARAEAGASQAAAASKAPQGEQASQPAAASKAQQEEQDRQAAAAAKPQQDKAQQEEQGRQAALAKAEVRDALKNGKAALDREDYAEAMRWYRKAADQGNADAQNNIGWIYEHGRGVPQDFAKAMRWYRKAADQGNADAQNNIGWIYERDIIIDDVSRGNDIAEALRWYRKAADQGNADAQNNIGRIYEDGRGVGRDYTEAMRWFRKAADQGNAYAQGALAGFYKEGWGVPQDYSEAMRWYRKAADQGDAFAQIDVGELYENGWGVPQDYAEAMRWFRKAAAQGNVNISPIAQEKLMELEKRSVTRQH